MIRPTGLHTGKLENCRCSGIYFFDFFIFNFFVIGLCHKLDLKTVSYRYPRIFVPILIQQSIIKQPKKLSLE